MGGILFPTLAPAFTPVLWALDGRTLTFCVAINTNCSHGTTTLTKNCLVCRQNYTTLQPPCAFNENNMSMITISEVPISVRNRTFPAFGVHSGYFDNIALYFQHW